MLLSEGNSPFQELLGISKARWWSRAYRSSVVSAVGMAPLASLSHLLTWVITEGGKPNMGLQWSSSGSPQRRTTEDHSVKGKEGGELFPSEDSVRSYGRKQRNEGKI